MIYPDFAASALGSIKAAGHDLTEATDEMARAKKCPNYKPSGDQKETAANVIAELRSQIVEVEKAFR